LQYAMAKPALSPKGRVNVAAYSRCRIGSRFAAAGGYDGE
jgi:hypothetical protein